MPGRAGCPLSLLSPLHPPRARSQAPNYRAQFDHVSYREREGGRERGGAPAPGEAEDTEAAEKKNFDKTATDEEGLLRQVERERESVRKRRKGKKEEEEPNERTSLPAAVLFTRKLGAAAAVRPTRYVRHTQHKTKEGEEEYYND